MLSSRVLTVSGARAAAGGVRTGDAHLRGAVVRHTHDVIITVLSSRVLTVPGARPAAGGVRSGDAHLRGAVVRRRGDEAKRRLRGRKLHHRLPVRRLPLLHLVRHAPSSPPPQTPRGGLLTNLQRQSLSYVTIEQAIGQYETFTLFQGFLVFLQLDSWQLLHVQQRLERLASHPILVPGRQAIR